MSEAVKGNDKQYVVAVERNGLAFVVVEWLKGQPFTNVLLIGLLSTVTYGGYLAINYAVPAHLKQIQAGYETIDARHESRRTEDLKVQDMQINELRQTFDKTLDRYERIWTERFDKKTTATAGSRNE